MSQLLNTTNSLTPILLSLLPLHIFSTLPLLSILLSPSQGDPSIIIFISLFYHFILALIMMDSVAMEILLIQMVIWSPWIQ